MDSPYCPSHAPFFGFVGAALALIFGNMGAACAAAPGPVADSLYGEWRCVTDRAPPQVRDVEVGRRPRHHLQTAAPQGAPARPLAIPSARGADAEAERTAGGPPLRRRPTAAVLRAAQVQTEMVMKSIMPVILSGVCGALSPAAARCCALCPPPHHSLPAPRARRVVLTA